MGYNPGRAIGGVKMSIAPLWLLPHGAHNPSAPSGVLTGMDTLNKLELFHDT